MESEKEIEGKHVRRKSKDVENQEELKTDEVVGEMEEKKIWWEE